MTLQALRERIPDHAKDLRINLGNLERSNETLTPRQLWGAALASALTCDNRDLVAALGDSAGDKLDESEREAAAAASAIMAMNNVYYRFTHLVGDPQYAELPARLRMQVIGKPGVDKVDFELWCLAVSAINGCGACMDSHAKAVVRSGGTAKQVQETVRVAAIVRGADQALRNAQLLAAG